MSQWLNALTPSDRAIVKAALQRALSQAKKHGNTDGRHVASLVLRDTLTSKRDRHSGPKRTRPLRSACQQ